MRVVYRIDGQLIGISVIDILPNCVSSVYFIWDPEFAWASLGKLSAVREVLLARDIHAAGVESMKWVYMGWLVFPCAGVVELMGRLLDPRLCKDGIQVGILPIVSLGSGKPIPQHCRSVIGRLRGRTRMSSTCSTQSSMGSSRHIRLAIIPLSTYWLGNSTQRPPTRRTRELGKGTTMKI